MLTSVRCWAQGQRWAGQASASCGPAQSAGAGVLGTAGFRDSPSSSGHAKVGWRPFTAFQAHSLKVQPVLPGVRTWPLGQVQQATLVPCILSHLHRPPDLLLAPPPHSGLSPWQHLEWRGLDVEDKGPCPAGLPAHPAHAQLSLCSPYGPTVQPGEVGRLSVIIPTLLMRKLSPGKGSGHGTFSFSWLGHVPA